MISDSLPRGDWVFFSPHLDDAVLSCGGTIAALAEAARSRPPTVTTVFAGSPRPGELTDLARSFAAMWAATGDPVAARRAEDRAALGRLGAHCRHLEHRDCIFRIAADGSPLYADFSAIFGAPPPAAEHVVAAIVSDMRAALSGLVQPTVVVPLGVGAHIDHRLVRSAGELLVRGGELDEAGLVYFEDLPYAVNGSHPDWRATVAADLEPCAVPLDDDWWATKLDAVRAYRSQLPPTASLWPDETAMLRDLRGRQMPECDAPAVEWLWRRTAWKAI